MASNLSQSMKTSNQATESTSVGQFMSMNLKRNSVVEALNSNKKQKTDNCSKSSSSSSAHSQNVTSSIVPVPVPVPNTVSSDNFTFHDNSSVPDGSSFSGHQRASQKQAVGNNITSAKGNKFKHPGSTSKCGGWSDEGM